MSESAEEIKKDSELENKEPVQQDKEVQIASPSAKVPYLMTVWASVLTCIALALIFATVMLIFVNRGEDFLAGLMKQSPLFASNADLVSSYANTIKNYAIVSGVLSILAGILSGITWRASFER